MLEACLENGPTRIKELGNFGENQAAMLKSPITVNPIICRRRSIPLIFFEPEGVDMSDVKNSTSFSFFLYFYPNGRKHLLPCFTKGRFCKAIISYN